MIALTAIAGLLVIIAIELVYFSASLRARRYGNTTSTHEFLASLQVQTHRIERDINRISEDLAEGKRNRVGSMPRYIPLAITSKTDMDVVDVCDGAIASMLEDPMVLARSARIVPSVRDGQMIGFRLYTVRPGSLYEAFGFRNGDTVSTVNGRSLTSPDQALEVYYRLKTATSYDVGLWRGGNWHRIIFLRHEDCARGSTIWDGPAKD